MVTKYFSLVVAILAVSVQSFTTSRATGRDAPFVINAIPTQEESAKALSDYMAKSHEEKLKAVKAVEKAKESEIMALKAEIESLKGNGAAAKAGAPVSLPTSTAGSVDELNNQLVAYKEFIAKYIIEAHDAKVQAVRDAEAAITAKFEAKLLLSAGEEVSAPPPVKGSSVYEGRNEKVIASAAAGKSRWGDAEVQKITSNAGSSSRNVATDKDIAPVSPQMNSLYEKRNIAVAAAAAAGKSRWGPMETSKAKSLVGALPEGSQDAPAIVITPEIEAADHGLKSDGSLSLAERVNLGSKVANQ
mmetsp:Transcript_17599/g.26716  ORF Transcript_17599/g.26716 Transcript_17599/m.26716 type:complete len:302 (-) Transcript_17599:107-1012(-)|eukprot:CAMPEP_0178936260 /NCGR_PEP_ID=MMETSP0786-20121207/25075_1 /TAXON_ID=186022 /ORGANISM="Thalassionema frauenfeldii, Strain CCMP 1798" /LENGTH=301 /DNA_ID=CAMNT_0020614645 /DNA_START=49 /DNA_END=954 /DNA_ORIENTATION=+